MPRFTKAILPLMLAFSFLFAGCGSGNTTEFHVENQTISAESESETADFDWFMVPAYTGAVSVQVNHNEPFFTEKELAEAEESFESYSDLDRYGRCGAAIASVGKETMPTEERGDISSIHPTGWWAMKESTIQPERCHLIAFMLTGENANPKNLITGTHQMNVGGDAGSGMLTYETMVQDQIEKNGGHVLYRVTPYFEGNDELARGVLMEAESVEDDGKTLSFCTFVYNEQEGWTINHLTGTAEYDGDSTSVNDDTAYGDAPRFILNTNSRKIHRPDCSSLRKTSESNKKATNKSLADLEKEGYTLCQICKPK